MKRIVKALLILLGVLIGAYLVATLLINIHGERELQKALARAEAQGISMDWSDYVPDPIPNEENLYALPEWERFWNKKYKFSQTDNSLSKTVSFLYPEDWRTGNLFPERWFAHKQKQYKNRLGLDLNDEAAVWGQVDQELAPYREDLDALVQTAWSRSGFQLPYDGSESPFMFPLLSFGQMRNFGRALCLDGILALQASDTERAFGSLQTLGRISALNSDAPFVTSQMASQVIFHNNFMPLFYSGLHDGLWSDEQLAWAENYLGDIHYLERTFWSVRSEMAAIYSAWNEWLDWDMVQMFTDCEGRPPNSAEAFGLNLAPDGYVKANLAKVLEGHEILVSSFNPETGSFDPEIMKAYNQFDEELDENAGIFYALAAMTIGVFDGSVSYALSCDAYARMGAIACALERYKLAEHTYPDNLNILAPTWMADIPGDPAADGAPFHYEVVDNRAAYRLWSLGGNRLDDGGIVALEDSGSKVRNDAGDWVFPYPKAPNQG